MNDIHVSFILFVSSSSSHSQVCWIVLSVICSWHSAALLSVPAAYATRCSLPPNTIFHQDNPTADKLIRRISSQQKLKVAYQSKTPDFLASVSFFTCLCRKYLLPLPAPTFWAADYLLPKCWVHWKCISFLNFKSICNWEQENYSKRKKKYFGPPKSPQKKYKLTENATFVFLF